MTDSITTHPALMRKLMTVSLSDLYVQFQVSAENYQYQGSQKAVRQRLGKTNLTRIAWVRIPEDEEDEASDDSHLLPNGPQAAQVAQHNHSPAIKQKNKPEPGRLYDSQREWTTPTLNAPDSQIASRWRAFVDASAYPALMTSRGMIVDEEWLVQNGPDYSQPWLAGVGEEDADMKGIHLWQSKRKTWWVRAQRTILRNPIIPLVFRSIVFLFSAIALGLAGSIYHRTKLNVALSNTPSTDMAIVVDAVALVYILYITYDEYTGKPLGLRSARAKLRLIFLDLIFIVFNSANLSLAFEGLHGRSGACSTRTGGQDLICQRQRGLASVLLIALIAWLLNFSTSVLR